MRQSSKELGKRANLEIRGGQVELDRSVLDKIGAPLEHLLRNADRARHRSAETCGARGQAGDRRDHPLGVKQEGNEIVLSFADDGGGLDFERIRARAVENRPAGRRCSGRCRSVWPT